MDPARTAETQCRIEPVIDNFSECHIGQAVVLDGWWFLVEQQYITARSVSCGFRPLSGDDGCQYLLPRPRQKVSNGAVRHGSGQCTDRLIDGCIRWVRKVRGQFVPRFQRRLIAFAVGQVDQIATAEDLVQDTFISFLKAVPNYRAECELESFLFQLLRRRIVDQYRRQGRNKEIPACSFNASASTQSAEDPVQQAVGEEMHASWYALRNESHDNDKTTLSAAVHLFTSKLQAGEKFRDLKIAEGLFYAGRRNQELAQVMGTSESEISLVKHRLVKRLRQLVQDAGASADDDIFADESFNDLLTSVWESQRPSCPKRTTLGKFTLGILPPQWDDFVDFHVNILGCTFCVANLTELSSQNETNDASFVNDRLFNSTVGFLKSV